MQRLASLILAATLVLAFVMPIRAAEPYSAILKYKQGDNRKDCSAIEDQVRATVPAGYKAIEARLLATLQSADASADCKFFVCRQLMIVGGDDSVPALAALLTDETLTFAGRFALERNPSPKAAAALRDALGKTNGKVQLGIISSIGARKDAAAIGDLAKLAASSDAAIATSAIRALGYIGTAEAGQALASLKIGDTLAKTTVDAQLECARLLAARGSKADAVAIYKQVKGDELVQAAAFKGLVAAETPANAAKLAIDAVEGTDAARRDAAASAVGAAPKEVRDAIAQALPSLKTAGQAALLAAIVDQSDVTLRPTLLKLIAGTDAAVRGMALEGLANHGEADDVEMLVKLATAETPEAQIARKTLDRMGKSGVDDVLGKLATAGPVAQRQVAIKSLTSRKVLSSLPALCKLAAEKDAAIAIEALKAIGDIGTATELLALLDVLGTTTDASVRSTAEKAAQSISARAQDKKPCSQALAAALKKAAIANVRASLLRILQRVGDDVSLSAVREMLGAAEADVKDAAIRTLSDWPNVAAAPDLARLMKESTDAKYQVLALRGYVQLAALSDTPVEQRAKMYKEAISAARRDEEKRTIIAGLATLPVPESLDLLAAYAKEDVLGDEVAIAACKVARNLGPLAGAKAKATLVALKSAVKSDERRKQIDAAIAEVSKGAQRDGYIIGWLVSGPYERDGKGNSELFDIAFAPETGGGNWRPIMPSPNNFIELDKAIGGDNRVAYLKTTLVSQTEQEITFEIGSDDGFKLWLNGKLIGGNNTNRGCTPGSDKGKGRLNKGSNTVLLKVTQGSGEWAAVVRLNPSTGITVGGE